MRNTGGFISKNLYCSNCARASSI